MRAEEENLYRQLVPSVRLRQLRCFVAVARKKSFGLAAEGLGLTQPAVSRSVRELEQIVGQDLFDRSKRGANLTDRGRALLDAAEAGLFQITQGLTAAAGGPAGSDTVRIGALPNVCAALLPGIVRDFKADYPEVRIRIGTGTNAELLADLRCGGTDMVIGRLSESGAMRGLVFEALYDEPLVFVVRRGHPLAEMHCAIENVLAYPLLLPVEDTIIRHEVSRFFAAAGVSRIDDLIETLSTDFQRAYLLTTDCVAVAPRGAVAPELGRGLLVQLPLGGNALNGPVGLTTNPEARLIPAVQTLLQRIRTAFS